MKNIDINQIKYLYYREKKSASEIARVFDCDPATIYIHMEKNGMQRRSASESQKIRYNNRVYDKHRSKLDLAEIRRLYFQEHLSLVETGEKLGVSPDTIRRRLIQAGYKCRKQSESRRPRASKFTEVDCAEMKRLYCEEELSSAEIARRFDCTNMTIKMHLEQQGVQLRTAKEAQALRRKKEAEQKSVGTGLVPDQPNGSIPPEQVTPARILQLRNEENLTIDAIAERCSLSNLEVYNILEEMGGL